MTARASISTLGWARPGLAFILLAACGSDAKSPDVATTPDTGTDVAEPDAAPDATPDVAPDAWTPNVYTYPACGTAASDLAGCVDQTKLEQSLAVIAGPRTRGSAKWQATQDLCKSTFEGLGYTTTLQPSVVGMNVIGVKTGTTRPSEQVIIGAHYDGVQDCDAADDNGSGVAGVLEAARVLATGSHARTLVVVCWDDEEIGLIGSTVHAGTIDPPAVKAVFDFEMIGFTTTAPDSQSVPLGFAALFPAAQSALNALGNRGVFITNITADNARGPSTAFASAAETIGLPVVTLELQQSFIGLAAVGDLHRSDHASFWRRGVPALQLTDTANFRNPNYHCPTGNTDTVATLDFAFMRAVVAATVVATKTTLDADDPGVTHVPHTVECDLAAQDCGAGQRCAFVRGDESFRRTCIPAAAEPAGVGELCTRLAGDVPGKDTCAAGLYCTFYGGVQTNADIAAPAFDRICSQLCDAGTECGDGAECMGIGTSFFEPTGVCRPTCADVFGTACGKDQKCAPASLVQGVVYDDICQPAGKVAPGGACQGSIDCGSGHACVTPKPGAAAACSPYCTATAPCPDGLTCLRYTYRDPSVNLGVCVER